MLAVVLEQDPPSGHKGDKDHEVDDVIVRMIFQSLAHDTDEEDQTDAEVFCLDEQVYLLHIVGGKEETVGGLEGLEQEKDETFYERVLTLDI